MNDAEFNGSVARLRPGKPGEPGGPCPADLIADALHEHLCAHAPHAWPDVARRDRRRHQETAHAVLAALERHQVNVVPGGLARFRTFLDEDFRQWCSPNGIAAEYAGRLLEIFDRLTSTTEELR